MYRNTVDVTFVDGQFLTVNVDTLTQEQEEITNVVCGLLDMHPSDILEARIAEAEAIH
jgi:hypothetical protein